MRFLRVDGENYGRSYVDMYYGDLNNLEVLTKSVTQASTAAAKVIYLVNPNTPLRHQIAANDATPIQFTHIPDPPKVPLRGNLKEHPKIGFLHGSNQTTGRPDRSSKT